MQYCEGAPVAEETGTTGFDNETERGPFRESLRRQIDRG
jgi:hypothetical protein